VPRQEGEVNLNFLQNIVLLEDVFPKGGGSSNKAKKEKTSPQNPMLSVVRSRFEINFKNRCVA